MSKMPWRLCKSVVVFVFALAFLLTMDGLLPQTGDQNPGYAEAQRVKKVRKKRRTLIEMLFGRQQKIEKKARRKPRYRKIKRRKKRKVAAVPFVPKVEKLEDARVVLVVGDFFAGALAKGLTRTFNKSPDIRVVRVTKGSSGFIRLDYYNWAEEIAAIIEEKKPAVVLTMIGTNDRQLMRLDGKKLPRRSDEWDQAYNLRIEKFAQAIRSRKIPLIWLGLPPVRFKKMNQDFLDFNEIYRGKAEKAGGQFIDVWDGFSDADGNFVTSGPNVAGQIVRLRSSDGINVTRSGQNKLAFYAEKAVRKLVGGSSTGALAGLRPTFEPDAEPLEPTYDPAKTGQTIVINLEDPAIDGGSVLAGGPKAAGERAFAGAQQSQDGKISGGLVVGRVDDFSWPRKSLEKPLLQSPPEKSATGRI